MDMALHSIRSRFFPLAALGSPSAAFKIKKKREGNYSREVASEGMLLWWRMHFKLEVRRITRLAESDFDNIFIWHIAMQKPRPTQSTLKFSVLLLNWRHLVCNNKGMWRHVQLYSSSFSKQTWWIKYTSIFYKKKSENVAQLLLFYFIDLFQVCLMWI